MPDSLTNNISIVETSPDTAMTSVAEMSRLPKSAVADRPVSEAENNVAADFPMQIADSITPKEEIVRKGIVLERRESGREGELRDKPLGESTWIVSTLILLFIIICFRYRNNFKYIKALVHDLTDIRPRHNVFDDTVRETSLLVILNLLSVISTGILAFMGLCLENPRFMTASVGLMSVAVIGATAGYYLWQIIVYWMVGNVYSDSQQTTTWLKGFGASQGISGIILFPLALVSLLYPQSLATIITVAACCYIFFRIIFIWRGLRIFFTHFSSLLLFLYYLCTLEIVPIAIMYGLIHKICQNLI